MTRSLAESRSWRPGAALALLLCAAISCTCCSSQPTTVADSSPEAAPADAAPSPEAPPPDAVPPAALYLQLDATLPAWLGPRLQQLLGPATTLPVRGLDPKLGSAAVPAGSVILALGATPVVRELIPSTEVAALQPDGFIVRSRAQDQVTVLAAAGRLNPKHHGLKVNLGTLYGAYAALEALGFGFLHPLAPHVPQAIALPTQDLDQTHRPHWPERGLHVHTMHPIELTNLLNGWGRTGHNDAKGFEAMKPEWRLYNEWLLANRQNLVEWVLLSATDWSTFAESKTRQQRLAALVDICHEYGIAAGVDVGIALQQQHTFRLITQTGELAAEKKQLRARADYLMAAGFDFLSTEIGTSEFTSPDDKRMLAWIDELGTYLDSKYGKKVHIKVHCSQGQTASNYKHPRTGKPLNYNFLPHYAVPQVGVLPHTVQVYALDDPAPTYGNQDFGFIRDFLRLEGGARDVLWHPETAYWVSYDVDVPLFLPVYAERRLRDLRLIADDEAKGLVGDKGRAGSRIQGQMIFSSGWEWGYWLNDVVTARGAYAPPTSSTSDEAALKSALLPVLRPFGSARAELAALLAQIARQQRELLILGQVGGKAPSKIERRNGQAYMQGWETFDDVASLVAGLPGVPRIQTQPDKLGLVSMRNPLHPGPSYSKELRPLLAAMASTFAVHHSKLAALQSKVPTDAAPLMQELVDAAQMNALRARQLLGLYDYVDGLDLLGKPSAAAKVRLKDARDALDAAIQVVARREKSYRVPVARVAGWGQNPTAYPFGFLWTVHTLHYWWRDEGKAVEGPTSPCYLNIIDPTDVAFGEGFWVDAAPTIQSVLKAVGLGSYVGKCLTGPSSEPTYPPPGLRP